MTQNASNPLLQFDRLPDFGAIRAEHIQPAITEVLADNNAQLDKLIADLNGKSPDWENLMDGLDDMEDRLSKVWSTASHLNGVCNTPEIRDAYNGCQPMITEYYAGLGQNRALFELVTQLSERADELALTRSQRKILRDMLLEFELAGVSLSAEQQPRFTEIQTRLSDLSNRFGNNVLDATTGWSHLIKSEDELAGVPALTIQAAKEAAERKSQQGYLLTLDFPCYFAVMSYADNAALRETMYRAFTSRAANTEDSAKDNSGIIKEILALREEMADILGYPNYAAVSVATKMARSVADVNHFLDDLIKHSRPAAEKEFAELQAFARDVHAVSSIQAWDVPYYSEKLRKQDFDLSQEELRPWFPLAKVQQGMFAIVETLYGISIERDRTASVWHEDVEFYNIRRDGELVARFYLDLFTREGKRGGAWMADCRSRRLTTTNGQPVSQQIPVAYLVCNFAPPTSDKPALLTHNDVTTLFHEFGHGLHHMLTQENYLRCSGIAGVAWDAVELPSQLMENWCWDNESLGLISGHYETGEPLPQTLLDKMQAAKNFQAGMKSVRQLEFALFDFQLHQTQIADSQQDVVRSVMQGARDKAAVYPVPDENRFENSFSHIFAGGYAAGYYSYKWAEVLSADVFSQFQANGVLDSGTGQAFLDKILSKGGGEDALTLFVDFMGREPDMTALLRQDGLEKH
ncbi:oligopeptidase A [Pseudohongiella nitratireducens]|uniref:oligopeptidase A n=1 Tax=Pseudohongiella nitratireducens TaxID=1768907 RepID=A0A917GW97_9GAMM|nr:M3 family metallopeptidase [Pseudohongiella nitratireducens]MDF1623964.1 M3 family metallopeptidase [Pseudohongiella nitratireducens]GGG59147.1 oligopeptidase A [Pseudohongiella nitratireducens]